MEFFKKATVQADQRSIYLTQQEEERHRRDQEEKDREDKDRKETAMAPAAPPPTPSAPAESESAVGPHPSYLNVSQQYVFQQQIQDQLVAIGTNPTREDNNRLAGVQWINDVRIHLQL